MKNMLYITQIVFIIISIGVLNNLNAQEKVTHWEIKTSSALDGVCLLNTLTGDPYYLQFYTDDYNKWTDILKSKADKNITLLYKMKTKRGIIISSYLTYMLGSNPDTTIIDLKYRFENDFSSIKTQLKKSGNYNNLNWLYFRLYKKEIKGYLELLSNANFDSIYYQDIKPDIQHNIDSLASKISGFNIVPYIENFFGEQLESDTITIYLLNFTKPHGISIGNNRFITYYNYNIKIYINNAIHEVLHKPVNNFLSNTNYIKELKKDTFIYNAFLNHDKNFGYNNFFAAIEESCVRFLEQAISEKLGTSYNAKERWKNDDKGMHVFAAILYQVYTEKPTLSFKELIAEAVEQCKNNEGVTIYNRLYYNFKNK
jgi:hypothetical protein